MPQIFQFVQSRFDLSPAQMLKIFNYGSGMAVFIEGEQAARQVVSLAAEYGLKATVAGYTEAADKREVVVVPLGVVLSSENFLLAR